MFRNTGAEVFVKGKINNNNNNKKEESGLDILGLEPSV